MHNAQVFSVRTNSKIKSQVEERRYNDASVEGGVSSVLPIPANFVLPVSLNFVP